jgi:hypothetical protein
MERALRTRHRKNEFVMAAVVRRWMSYELEKETFVTGLARNRLVGVAANANERARNDVELDQCRCDLL